MTMTGTVRSMDRIGARDITVGQKWRHTVTEKTNQRTFDLVAIDGDRAILTCAEAGASESVSFGALLAEWMLVGEA